MGRGRPRDTPSSAPSLGFSHAAPEEDTPAPDEDTPAPDEDTPAPETPETPEHREELRLGELAVTDTAPDSLRLSWSVAQGPFDSFVVQYQDAEGQPQALLVDSDQNEVLITALEPSTTYKFFLYGLHEGMRLGPLSVEGTTGARGLASCLQSGRGPGGAQKW